MCGIGLTRNIFTGPAYDTVLIVGGFLLWTRLETFLSLVGRPLLVRRLHPQLSRGTRHTPETKSDDHYFIMADHWSYDWVDRTRLVVEGFIGGSGYRRYLPCDQTKNLTSFAFRTTQ